VPWHTFQHSSAQEAAGAGMKVLDQFAELYTRLRGPPDVAIFCRQEPGGDHVTYWLTPATEQRAPALLRLFGAKPGPVPPANATLLGGVTGKRPSDFK
jgi:hypothetical protein